MNDFWREIEFILDLKVVEKDISEILLVLFEVIYFVEVY